jgi:hypothetical protein
MWMPIKKTIVGLLLAKSVVMSDFPYILARRILLSEHGTVNPANSWASCIK